MKKKIEEMNFKNICFLDLKIKLINAKKICNIQKLFHLLIFYNQKKNNNKTSLSIK